MDQIASNRRQPKYKLAVIVVDAPTKMSLPLLTKTNKSMLYALLQVIACRGGGSRVKFWILFIFEILLKNSARSIVARYE